MTKADRALARKATKNGARYAKRIIGECRGDNLAVSLGFALIHHESNFTNVFGHDPSIFRGAGRVTRLKYRHYKALRGSHGQGGMQGVGPAQLTYYTIQDRADAQGGCWRPGINIKVGLAVLKANIDAADGDVHAGLMKYNGSGPAAHAYADAVTKLQHHWHRVLTS